MQPIKQSRVRYIKLGGGGSWEKECIKRGIIRLGFGTARPERLAAAQKGKWDKLAAMFVAEGKTKGTATNFTRQVQTFFEDDGSILWITFVGERLYWGSMTAIPAAPHADGDGVWRAIRGGWRCDDILGEPLTKDRLSGALTKLAGFQGTSCDVDVSDYVVRRINGKKVPAVERALAATTDMRAAALDLMRLLGPKDFELLVDLVFTTSGWRRVGDVGKAQKMLDLDVVLPSTGERAFVQVKAKTSSAELAEYAAALEDGPHDRMFYVFHSGTATIENPRVSVIGPERLAELVVDAGLVGWLIRKVS